MPGTLVVGDVHGCAEELDRLLRRVAPERVLLVGDLFTKGPDPVGVWDLIREWNADAVLGNHDEDLLADRRGVSALPRKALRWLADRPFMVRGPGWLVVHAGVNPKAWRKTCRHDALNLRRWRGSDRYWWQLYDGPRLVVHGHDSRHGLIDRRPHTLGIDTGCVKGGRLTGYLLDEDEVVSVKARRAWA